jgi:hypothetical protein
MAFFSNDLALNGQFEKIGHTRHDGKVSAFFVASISSRGDGGKM